MVVTCTPCEKTARSSWRRVNLDVGATNEQFVHVEDGLDEGAVVAMNPRQLLDLVELPELASDDSAAAQRALDKPLEVKKLGSGPAAAGRPEGSIATGNERSGLRARFSAGAVGNPSAQASPEHAMGGPHRAVCAKTTCSKAKPCRRCAASPSTCRLVTTWPSWVLPGAARARC